MENHFLVVNGHPDPRARRYCAALCDAYAAGVRSRGWNADRLDVGRIMAPSLLVAQDAADAPLLGMTCAINRIREAERLAIVFPLWLGAAPHALQQLFESVEQEVDLRQPPIAADLVVTMDLPALLYRPRSTTHVSAEAKRNPFYLQGVRAAETILIGSVNVLAQSERERWLDDVRKIAERAIDRHVNAKRRSILGWRIPISLRAWLMPTISGREPDVASWR